jgi:hypothetical protein
VTSIGKTRDGSASRGPTCDLNGDGRSDIRDIVRVANCALEASECPDSVAVHADCNGDGTVDVRDVVCCVRRLLEADQAPLILSEDFNGEPTRLRFEGSARWLEPRKGIVEVQITPGTTFGGLDFWFSAANAGARITGIRLAPGSGYQLQSRVTGSGESARAVLLPMGDASRPRPSGSTSSRRRPEEADSSRWSARRASRGRRDGCHP